MKVAFVDIGTNSIRYLAVSISPSGKFSILTRGLTAPRLGEGLSGSGRLRPEAISRTLKKLKKIKTSLEARGVKEFECAGTEALRKAANARVFVAGAEKLDLKVKILSGEEEAELIYLGATRELNIKEKKITLIDVGGGSTEIITITKQDRKPTFLSLPLGCVRLKEQFGPGGKNVAAPFRVRRIPRRLPRPVGTPPLAGSLAGKSAATTSSSGIKESASNETAESDRWRAIKNYCLLRLREEWPYPLKNLPLIGLGGTFTTLAAIHLKLSVYRGEKVHGQTLPRREIEKIFQLLQSISLKKRKEVPGLPPARADIIVPGTIIIRAVMEHTGAEEVTISDRGLLFGLLQQFLSQ